MDWNEAQKSAIEGGGNSLVSASAGSGKTAVIVERVIRLLTGGEVEGLDSPVPITSVLLLSFNNSIAAEMKDKIHAALIARAGEADGALIREQIDNLPLADITTMHGFCKKLITERFDALGIDPAFTVADGDESSRLFSKAVAKVLEEAVVSGDVEAYALREFLGGEERLKEQIAHLHGFALSQKEGLAGLQGKWLAEYRKPLEESMCVLGALKRIREDAASCIDMFERFIPKSRAAGLDRLASHAEECILEARRLAELSSYADAHAYIRPSFSQLRYNKAEKELDPDERYKRECAAIKDKLKAIAAYAVKTFSVSMAEQRARIDSAYKMLTRLTAFVIEADERYTESKRESNRLDFNDLEQLAYKLICDRDIAKEIGDRYRYICVDEYQDINGIQEAIISGVSGDRGNLFMVGDSKQSIYGFRHTDTGIFLNKYGAFSSGEGGSAYRLNFNYRSSPRILEFVNEIFDKIMTVGRGGVDYAADSRFDAGLDYIDDSGMPEASIAVFTGGEEDKIPFDWHREVYSVMRDGASGNSSICRREAAYIADRIMQLLRRGKIIRDGVARPVTYSDITLLATDRSPKVSAVIEELRRMGLPVSGGGLVRDKGNVYIDRLIDFLRTVDNFRQDLPLAASLMYFGGFTCDECARMRAGDREYLWQAIVDYAERDDALALRLKDFLACVRRYRFMSGFTRVSDLVGKIARDYDYAERASAECDGGKLAAELKAFISSIADKSYDSSLAAFLDAVQDGYGDDLTVSADGDECIKAMTVHASKGLEFPVVFFIDCGRQFSRSESRDKLVAHKDIGLGMDGSDSERRLLKPNIIKSFIKDTIADESIDDRMRLFYVALTRARNYLFVTGTLGRAAYAKFGSEYKDGVSSMADWLSNVCCLDPSFEDKYVVRDSDAEIVGEDIKSSDAVFTGGKDCDYLRDYAQFEYPHKECVDIGIKYSVSAINKENYDSGASYGGSISLFGEESDTIGTAYHRVLSLIDFGVSGEEGVAAAIADMAASGELSDHSASLVDCKVIADCISSPLISRARHARHLREKKFTLCVPACDVLEGCATSDDILVQGAIDLMILGGESGGENVLVDFKYTSRPPSEVKKAYAKQIELYALAMEKCAGVKPDRKVLFLLGSNIELEM